ncbi:MAG: carboxypeptidase M32 [Candidatus Dormibacterales bacterium]
MSDNLQRLKEILAEVTDLTRASAVLEWDQETFMPRGGIGARAEQLAALQRSAHVQFTSDEVGRLLERAEGEVGGLPYDSDEASLVRVTRRDYEEARRISPGLVAEMAHAGSSARPAWEQARHDSDFKVFAPSLEKNVDLNRQLADALGYEKRPYDALINHTETGMTTDQLEAIFGEIKAAVVPLIADIAQHVDAVDDRVLYRGFDTALQLQYALDVAWRLGYDLEGGRQDLSTHPFSTTFGPGDSRITTRVSRDFFNECLFGSIHEAGHAMYTQGMGKVLDRTPVWAAASPGFHESQSRLWENLVGRSLPFWKHFYPSLKSVFPGPLQGVDDVAFYKAVNRCHPSLIRVESDEVTYNMHIMVRFELENEMLEGRLKVKDLPEAWNDRFKTYLGIAVPNDREGVLQDIHWSYVGFGIFPGYTIGNLIGAQLMEKIRTEFPDLDAQFERGEFSTLLGWLQTNIHRQVRKFTPNELLERATGKPMIAGPWIDYVRRKFGALYGLTAAKLA